MEREPRYRLMESPVGPIELTAADGVLTGVRLCGTTSRRHDFGGDNDKVLLQTEKQLREYFAGQRRAFDLPLSTGGTAFQRKVWDRLHDISFGHTATYGDLARSVGSPRASRAVGGAVGANPLAIVVPCHRVLSGDGTLTGYSAGDGIATKKWLLGHESIEFRP